MKPAICCWRLVILLVSQWLYEDGIGEERAILLQKGRIITVYIERHDGIKAGLIAKAQLTKILVPGKRGIVKLDTGEQELLLSPIPAGLTEGASLMIAVTREAVREALQDHVRYKLPLAKAAPDTQPQNAPRLIDRIGAGALPVRLCHSHEADYFEEAGWGEVMEEARSGKVDFATGSLLIAATPAMTLIDVDGDAPPLPLSLAAATATAQAIQRLGIQGSIGIDFPNLSDKVDRQAVAEVFDAAMIGPFERTAVNGFGFLQLITRRQRPSLLELMQGNAVQAHLMALLRRAERDRGAGPMALVAHPAITAQLSARADWMEQLAKRTGRRMTLQSDPALDMGGGYVTHC
jgi:hypothetical protein